MTFLPIVDRELRVAARRPTTYWTRITATGVAGIIAGSFLFFQAFFTTPTTGIGKILFVALAWVCLAAVLVAGLFFTSDCLSEEKREGTLGLLFLTDLRGYDVVFGKLLATSLHSFLALLAVFPILAISLLLGGVTGAEFWKTNLALLSTLLFSLMTGLLASALSQAASQAIGRTLLILGLFCILDPALDAIASVSPRLHPLTWLRLASPLFLFKATHVPGGAFWAALLVNQCLAWSLLALACLIVPHYWQQKASRVFRAKTFFGSGAVKGQAARTTILDKNPLAWLMLRDIHFPAIWLRMTLPAAIILGCIIFAAWKDWRWLKEPALIIGWGWLGVELLLLWFRAAWQSASSMAELRSSGFVELLLVAPLDNVNFVRVRDQAMFYSIGTPWLILTVAAVGFAVASFDLQLGGNISSTLIAVFGSVLFASLLWGFELMATTRLGMLFGFRTGKPMNAWWRTILWGMLIPLVICLLPPIVCLWPLFPIFFLFKAAYTISVATLKFREEFRQVTTRSTNPAAPPAVSNS